MNFITSQIIQFHNFVSIHSKCLYSVTITFSKPLWQLIQWQDVMKIIKISRFWGQNMDKFLMHIKILALLNCRTCFNHLITREEVGKKEMYHLHLEWKFPTKNSSISENRFIIFQIRMIRCTFSLHNSAQSHWPRDIFLSKIQISLNHVNTDSKDPRNSTDATKLKN